VIGLFQRRVAPELQAIFTGYNQVVRAVSVLLGLIALRVYAPEPLQFVSLCGVSAAFLGLTVWTRRRESLVYAAAVFVFAAWAFVHKGFHGEPVGLADFLGIALILVARQAGLRFCGAVQGVPPWAMSVVAALGISALWYLIGRLAGEVSEGMWITIAWSLLAFATLGAGFALKDRIYRLAGLAILGVSVGRVFLVDVWQFDTVFRILSFLVLGVVLLALGFLYNRLAGLLRKWM
jgi:uncharacterized membrane protein